MQKVFTKRKVHFFIPHRRSHAPQVSGRETLSGPGSQTHLANRRRNIGDTFGQPMCWTSLSVRSD
jgi:hypothetical protein